MTSGEKNCAIFSEGKRCPFCGDMNILGAYIDHYLPGIYRQRFMCFKCEGRWEAIFRLVDVQDIEM